MVSRSLWTGRIDGDLGGPLNGRAAPRAGRAAEAPWPWTWLEQVHGADVVVVGSPGEHAGARADAAVTATPGCTLAVRTADCAPVVLRGERSVGIAHAGWKGLVAGVLPATVDAMRALGDDHITAELGPCIRAGCYEFGDDALTPIEERFGAHVRSTTTWRTPALDVPAVVAGALREVGVDSIADDSGCTACDRRWFSHRARGEVERFATLAWIEP